MKISKPVISFINKKLVIQYSPDSQEALNLVGMSWLDTKYGIAKGSLRNHSVVITDTDLLAHDDYIKAMHDGTVIVLTARASDLSASPKRLKASAEKLKAHGFKVIYRASLESGLKTVENIQK